MKEQLKAWCELHEKMIKATNDPKIKQRFYEQCFGGVQFACWTNQKEEEHYAHMWDEEWKPRLEELIYGY